MLSIDDEVTIVEMLAIAIGIVITWAIYYGSERAELPGEATIPNPNVADDYPAPSGRTLE